MLIFLGALIEGISINQQELSTVLGKIVGAAKNLELNSFEKTEIENNSYLYGSFEKVIIIVQYTDKDVPPNELLVAIAKEFIKKFSTILENYSNADIPKFKTFLADLKNIISKFKQEVPKEQKTEETPVKAEPVGVIEPPKDVEIGKDLIIQPMKRDAYPEGIPDYKRDEVLWNESEMVKSEYVAEFIEGMITHLQIFLSISLTHHYELFIDFSEYPAKPKISIGKGLSAELEKSLDELLIFYRSWDTKIPPHIIELVREFEAILMKFKVKGKLSDTDAMPETALPDLEPLPELPPLEEEPEEEQRIPEEPKEEGNQNNTE
jgi:hypothetical protein